MAPLRLGVQSEIAFNVSDCLGKITAISGNSCLSSGLSVTLEAAISLQQVWKTRSQLTGVSVSSKRTEIGVCSLKEAEAVHDGLPRDPSHSFSCQRALGLTQTSHCGPWKCSKESFGSRTTCGWGPGQQRVVRQECSGS